MMVAGIGFSLLIGVAPRNATLVDMLYQSRYLRQARGWWSSAAALASPRCCGV